MMESNINAGSQRVPADLTGFDASELEYGVSITDGCLDWPTTVALILQAHKDLALKK